MVQISYEFLMKKLRRKDELNGEAVFWKKPLLKVILLVSDQQPYPLPGGSIAYVSKHGPQFIDLVA